MLIHTREVAAHHSSYHGLQADSLGLQNVVALVGELQQVRGGVQQGREGEQGRMEEQG